MQKGILLLKDGTVFKGIIHGKPHNSIGEVVFNTSMTGYQEILTDPSYAGQILTMTYPLIGNYGINHFDYESHGSVVKGFVVREMCSYPSNFRCDKTLDQFLEENNIVAIEGIDTRALTKILREKGSLNGAIIVGEPTESEIASYLKEIDEYTIKEPVYEVTVGEKETHVCDNTKCRVALYDFGFKRNILRSLVRRGCEVTVYPASTSAEEIIKTCPDGIMLSNGPGDPKDCKDIIENIKKLFQSGIPMFGICLGHQLTALAMGGDTAKLKYGHRGTNHPVKDLKHDRTYITSQNHGYAVLADSISPEIGEVSHININDDTVEGVRYNNGVFTVQFHPEASSGAMDTGYLFDDFVSLMVEKKGRSKKDAEE